MWRENKPRTGVVAPDGVAVGVAEGILICIAVEAKILATERLRLACPPQHASLLETSTPTHWSQNGVDSSRSFPTPANVFFCTTAIGRVAWPSLRAGKRSTDAMRNAAELAEEQTFETRLTCSLPLPSLREKMLVWIKRHGDDTVIT
jgi:hypothetical protein